MHKNKLRKGLQRWKKIKRYSEIEGDSEREIEDIPKGPKECSRRVTHIPNSMQWTQEKMFVGTKVKKNKVYTICPRSHGHSYIQS